MVSGRKTRLKAIGGKLIQEKAKNSPETSGHLPKSAIFKVR